MAGSEGERGLRQLDAGLLGNGANLDRGGGFHGGIVVVCCGDDRTADPLGRDTAVAFDAEDGLVRGAPRHLAGLRGACVVLSAHGDLLPGNEHRPVGP